MGVKNTMTPSHCFSPSPRPPRLSEQARDGGQALPPPARGEVNVFIGFVTLTMIMEGL